MKKSRERIITYKPNKEFLGIALGEIEPGDRLIGVGFDSVTELPIVRKWSRE